MTVAFAVAQQDVREKAQAAGKKAVLRGRLETQQEEAQRQKDLAAQRVGLRFQLMTALYSAL